MAGIQIAGMDGLLQRLRKMPEAITTAVAAEIQAGAQVIASEAKTNAPGDTGILRNMIGALKKDAMTWEVFSGAIYSAYVEFGTGAKVDIPAGLEDFASQFQGAAGKGDVGDFVNVMIDWVRRHLEYFDEQEYDEESGAVIYHRGRVSKASEEDRIERIATAIVIKILRDGLSPRPFFFPAALKREPIIIERIKEALNNAI